MEGLQHLDSSASTKYMLVCGYQNLAIDIRTCMLEPPLGLMHPLNVSIYQQRLGYWAEVHSKCHSLMDKSNGDFLGVKDMTWECLPCAKAT